MAVYSDSEEIRKAMSETIANPYQLRWVKRISISYCPTKNVWIARIHDISIIFNDVAYLSNSIYFRMDGKDVAYITHAGLNDYARD